MSQRHQQKNRLLSPKEASDLAGVSKKTLIRWEQDNRLECVRSGPNGHRRYRESDILALGNGSTAQSGEDWDPFDDDFPWAEGAAVDPTAVEAYGSPRINLFRNGNSGGQESTDHRQLMKKAKEIEKQKRNEAQQLRQMKDQMWLDMVKNDARLTLYKRYRIPGIEKLEFPPDDIVLRANLHMDKMITIANCPNPFEPDNPILIMKGCEFGRRVALEVINEWLMWERENALAKQKAGVDTRDASLR